jgi:hypothetical protein
MSQPGKDPQKAQATQRRAKIKAGENAPKKAHKNRQEEKNLPKKQ